VQETKQGTDHYPESDSNLCPYWHINYTTSCIRK